MAEHCLSKKVKEKKCHSFIFHGKIKEMWFLGGVRNVSRENSL